MKTIDIPVDDGETISAFSYVPAETEIKDDGATFPLLINFHGKPHTFIYSHTDYQSKIHLQREVSYSAKQQWITHSVSRSVKK